MSLSEEALMRRFDLAVADRQSALDIEEELWLSTLMPNADGSWNLPIDHPIEFIACQPKPCKKKTKGAE
jgi:hypothetical protein